jgi:diketogulonate reductase-like aldo/keto reductase
MSTVQTVPNLRLSDGVEIPQLGFGLFGVSPEEAQHTVELAFEAGYRHLDTAAVYGNEKQVGAALAASGLSRPDYFVTAKLWCSRQGQDSTARTFEASLARLGLDHVDLCLVFRPIPNGGGLIDIWRALEQIRREGTARTIGVANFGIEDLELLKREAETLPTINQVELHPYCQEADLLAWHAEHGVVTAAWSPLEQGDLLGDEPTIVQLAERHGKTLTQVILRWHLQLGNVAIAGPVTPEGIRESVDLFDFELSDEERGTVGELDDNFMLLR